MTKLKNLKDASLLAEYRQVDEQIRKAECYGKFELNYRCEIEEEIQNRGLKI